MRHKLYRKRILVVIIALLSLLIAKYADWQIVPNKKLSIVKQQPGQQNIVWVKRVIDGDTIVLGNGERIRYIGINAPEIHHPERGVEYYGKEATEFNKRLVLGKNIRLEFDEDRYDKYGRTLAYVYLEDGVFVNTELVRQGYAKTMPIKPNIKYAKLFRELQEEAKREKRGMWGRK